MTTGLINSGSFVAANVRPSFAAGITEIMPNGEAPLLCLSSRMPKSTCINPTHSYWKRTAIFQSMTTTTSHTSSVTTLTVSDTTDIVAGMVFAVASTLEQIYVVSVDSSTSCTIARGIGTVAAAAIDSGVLLYLVGTAFEEASTRPTAVKINEVQVSNYTQIFRNAWALSGTATAVQKFVGDTPVADGRMQCAKFHARDIEMALMFSQKYSGTRNGQPFRKMEGVIDNCRANSRITAMGSTTTFAQLETALDPVFDTNTDPAIGSQRLLLVGGTARRVLNNIGRLSGTINIENGQTSFGMQFSQFKITRGTFTMLEHPLFNTNTLWAKYALCIDLGGFSLPYLGGRDTKPEEYSLDAGGNVMVGDSGIDAVGGSLLSELTMETRNPFANVLLTNLTAAAA